MRVDVLRRNIAITVEAMRVKTGKVPGVPTGLCHPVVLGSLTGRDMIFDGTEDGELQKRREREAGLRSSLVLMSRDMPYAETLTTLFGQGRYSLDAVMIKGSVREVKRRHVVAVVPEGNRRYHVIDSLLPGATTTFPTMAAVTSFLDKRFESVSFYGIPDERARQRRSDREYEGQTLALGNDVYIQAAPLSR